MFKLKDELREAMTGWKLDEMALDTGAKDSLRNCLMSWTQYRQHFGGGKHGDVDKTWLGVHKKSTQEFILLGSNLSFQKVRLGSEGNHAQQPGDA